MLDPTENARLALAVSVSIGLIVAGIGNLLLGSRRWAGQLLVGLAGTAAAAGIAWLFESEQTVWIGGGGLAALALLSVARADRVRRLGSAAVSPFRSAAARWAAVAAVGVGVVSFEFTRFDRVSEARLSADMQDLWDRVDRGEGVPVPGVFLVTDRGGRLTPIVPAAPRTPEQLRRSESLTLADQSFRTQLIHRGPPTDASNCHGWVFAGGRYGLGGRDVETILADNGYALVAAPAAGDLCIYRDPTGTVSHSAVVRAVCDDGTVLVEGKWGWMGVYLHPVQESCYGPWFAYYRTARASHVLPVRSDPPAAAALAGTP